MKTKDVAGKIVDEILDGGGNRITVYRSSSGSVRMIGDMSREELIEKIANVLLEQLEQ